MADIKQLHLQAALPQVCGLPLQLQAVDIDILVACAPADIVQGKAGPQASLAAGNAQLLIAQCRQLLAQPGKTLGTAGQPCERGQQHAQQ
jgi:hypothetical protein